MLYPVIDTKGIMNYSKFFFILCSTSILIGSPASVPNGGTGTTSMTAYAAICGGTTSISALQPIASLGSSGNPLVSNGAAALPTFQGLTFAGGGTGATSLSSGVIQSNGTVLSSLGIGSANQVLKNSAGTVGWSLTGVLQISVASTTSKIDTTAGSAIPDDDTIPQITEGTQILTLAFTPKSASSNLLIIFATGGTPTSSSAGIAALFVDSTANAFAAGYLGQRGSGASYSGVLQSTVASASTTSRTYQARVGGGAFQINAGATARKFGGVAATYLIVIEYI